jgi:hypothetical protein
VFERAQRIADFGDRLLRRIGVEGNDARRISETLILQVEQRAERSVSMAKHSRSSRGWRTWNTLACKFAMRIHD